jgi:hypothetical protein
MAILWKVFEWFSGKFQTCKFQSACTRCDGFVRTAVVHYVAKNALFISLLDFFPLNCVTVSDEHGECFHQDISIMERRYTGKWSTATLRDYCWMMKIVLLKQNTIDRPLGHVIKVKNILFLFITHITMLVLLSRSQELTNEFYNYLHILRSKKK